MKISILIATYRGAKRIQRLLQSMVDNNFNDEAQIELLIFDDGSPEEDYWQLQSVVYFSGVNHKVDHTINVKQVQHGGWISTINALVKESTGDVILLLDDDVLFINGLLSTIRQLMTIDNIGVLSWRSYGDRPGQSKIPRPGFLQPATELAGYCMSFTRQVWDEVGGLDTRFKVYCSDSDLALRVTLAGHPSYRVWWPLIPHEEHGCFDDAPELPRMNIVSHDLAEFKKKWNANGSDMENFALNKLSDKG